MGGGRRWFSSGDEFEMPVSSDESTEYGGGEAMEGKTRSRDQHGYRVSTYANRQGD